MEIEKPRSPTLRLRPKSAHSTSMRTRSALEYTHKNHDPTGVCREGRSIGRRPKSAGGARGAALSNNGCSARRGGAGFEGDMNRAGIKSSNERCCNPRWPSRPGCGKVPKGEKQLMRGCRAASPQCAGVESSWSYAGSKSRDYYDGARGGGAPRQILVKVPCVKSNKKGRRGGMLYAVAWSGDVKECCGEITEDEEEDACAPAGVGTDDNGRNRALCAPNTVAVVQVPQPLLGECSVSSSNNNTNIITAQYTSSFDSAGSHLHGQTEQQQRPDAPRTSRVIAQLRASVGRERRRPSSTTNSSHRADMATVLSQTSGLCPFAFDHQKQQYIINSSMPTPVDASYDYSSGGATGSTAHGRPAGAERTTPRPRTAEVGARTSTLCKSNRPYSAITASDRERRAKNTAAYGGAAALGDSRRDNHNVWSDSRETGADRVIAEVSPDPRLLGPTSTTGTGDVPGGRARGSIVREGQQKKTSVNYSFFPSTPIPVDGQAGDSGAGAGVGGENYHVVVADRGRGGGRELREASVWSGCTEIRSTPLGLGVKSP